MRGHVFKLKYVLNVAHLSPDAGFFHSSKCCLCTADQSLVDANHANLKFLGNSPALLDVI